MKNELEDNFGRTLQVLVTHLIKNAVKIPEPVLQAALDFQHFNWDKLDLATKRERVQRGAELTRAPSAIHRHMESYPHSFSKDRYAEYLTALRFYAESLGV